jgi:hypothetical protein
LRLTHEFGGWPRYININPSTSWLTHIH